MDRIIKEKTINQLKEPKYVITAVNQLTGEREVISKPHSRLKTEELLTRALRDNRRHCDGCCYSLYRMEQYQGEIQETPFTPPHETKPGNV